jgi:hypothetical protein
VGENEQTKPQDNLARIIFDVIPDPHKAMALYKDIIAEDSKLRQGTEAESFRAVMESGRGSLKSSLLINGGAAVAILTFIGHLAAQPAAKLSISSFAAPEFIFVLGVLTSSLAHGAVYAAQSAYHHNRKASGGRWNTLAKWLVVSSHLLFCTGAILCLSVFLRAP